MFEQNAINRISLIVFKSNPRNLQMLWVNRNINMQQSINGYDLLVPRIINKFSHFANNDDNLPS